MANFDRGQIVKYKGKPYVYFAKSMFLKDKHMIAQTDLKSNKLITTRVKSNEITLHEDQDVVNAHDVQYILGVEHEGLARHF